ncbi:MAG: 3-isopropylmalate dehydrogenase [Thermoleophilia bacterium]|nr:3-isopropylmalate dehydrogenase [Thermoleophilia bacterium]
MSTAALRVLEAIEPPSGEPWRVRWYGRAGEAMALAQGQHLSEPIAEFCAGIFGEGGAVLSGPGGGRYVYELRRRFGLTWKFVPIRPWPQIAGAGCLRRGHTADVDILIVRDNAAGVYQGTWREDLSPGARSAEHAFGYTEQEVRRLVEVAARAAAARRGLLTVVVKDGGVPTISALWRDVATATAREHGVRVATMNVDLAVYQVIQHPRQFDVIVAPNLCGDVLADVAGLLQRSRGVGFSGNFAADRGAVYQTNHGCAHDLTGLDRANPAGQIFALAMLLRESFGLESEADQIERGVAAAWEEGWRTVDLAEPGCRVVGTREMADRIVEAVGRRSPQKVRA